jgi:regulatory protein
VQEEVIERARTVLIDQGQLDDRRYAQRLVEDRRSLDGWGSERIERRLIAAGIDPELAAAALVRDAPADELAAAVEVLVRRLRQPPRDDRERSHALALLVRKGYELELAYDAVRRFEREG